MKFNTMKTLTSILITLLSLGYGFSQNTYYRSTDGKIIEEAKVKKQQQMFLEKYSKINDKAIVSIDIKDTRRTKDSIIHDFGFHIDLNGKEKKISELETMIGEYLPTAGLKTLNGEDFDLDRLKGKPSLFNFWFTKCKPCIDEMPVLNKLKEEYGDKVNFIAITYESNENVEEFLKKRDFEFKHITDAQNYIDKLGVTAFPVNLILDRDLRISKIESGIPYTKNKDGEFQIGEATDIKNNLDKLLK